MRYWPLLGLTLLIISSASACDGESGGIDPGAMVTDSAGVVIIENTSHPGDPGVSSLTGQPVLRLGSDDAEAPDFFGRVTSAHFDPRGNLWVVDAMSAEVRVFSAPSGEHLFTLGGRGQGPGEFQMPFPVGFDDERVWIWDQNLGRVSVFTLDGELVETERVGEERQLIPRLLHRTLGGKLVAQLPQSLSSPVEEGMLIHDTIRVWEFDKDVSEAELLLTRRGVTWYFAEGMQVPIPFAQGTRFAVRERRVVSTDSGGAPVFDVVEDGRLVRRIRVQRERLPVTPTTIERELESPVRSEAAQQIVRAHLSRLPIPDFLPTWEWVRIGSSGHVFALRYGGLLAEEIWDVFDPEGVLVGSVALPPEAHLVDADHRYLVLMEMPALRGPGVSLYAFNEAWKPR